MSRLKITRKHIVIAALLLTLIVGAPVLASETMTQTLTGGDRSASVAGADLGTLGYSHASQASPGTISISVDDSSGSGAGWNVTLQVSNFADGDRVIGAGNFSIVNAGAPIQTAGQEVSPTGGPKVPDSGAVGPLDTPRKVLHAAEGHGIGAYSQDLQVELTVPGGTLAGGYQAMLTVDIMAGP